LGSVPNTKSGAENRVSQRSNSLMLVVSSVVKPRGAVSASALAGQSSGPRGSRAK
jgi:hypothetical protein